ncbi:MAG: hypothetical protein NPIRA01_08250 [Nitrospirales bacterium]|nr:MAG: hypothetical protein NPIRA01_08250 [Nitrospirales bacterium]
MSNEVYANGSAVSCKSGDGKVIASFPDVCMSPPSPPAGPIPVPYPNTSFSKDMKNGSKTVKVNGKEVMLKDKSYYKTSPLGNEAATRSFGSNIMSHQITGKTYFVMWSMDVKFEGENVDRHTDLTTSNHGSYPAGVVVPNPEMEKLALARIADNACPCCDKKDCPAAFQPGDQALGFKEYYDIPLGRDATGKKIKVEAVSPRQEQRLKQFNEEIKPRLLSCSCTPPNEILPEPPCDVFRQIDQPRYKDIEGKWEEKGVKQNYRDWYEKTHGVSLKGPSEILSGLVASLGPEIAAILDADRKLSKGDPKRKDWDDLTKEANSKARINHKTPKEAGGCPTNPNNLQPQQTLCDACQEIDTFMTDNWQG